jgi:hypothetical protein
MGYDALFFGRLDYQDKNKATITTSYILNAITANYFLRYIFLKSSCLKSSEYSSNNATKIRFTYSCALFFGRLDYQDKNKRLNDSNMEFVWKGSPNNLGNINILLTDRLGLGM